jgi:hypothetical protein
VPRRGAPLREGPGIVVRCADALLQPNDAPAGAPTTLSIQPRVEQARLLGMFFDTNKSFLLPSAIADIRRVKALYDEHPGSELLIVGHTDTSGEANLNDAVSLERAESVAAYLKDDVDTWLGRYAKSVPAARRWGTDEDLLMLSTLPGFLSRPLKEDGVSWFQRTRGLTIDGIAGPETRRALIEEYMAHDETSLPEGVSVTCHGAGEHFPLEGGGQEVDSKPNDGERDAVDRRVEFFFFPKEFGIQPPAPGKNSSQGAREYPEWRKRATILHEAAFTLSDQVLRVRLQANGEPLADTEFALDVDGRRITVARTDAEGLVAQRLPAGATSAQIRVPRLGILRSVSLAPSGEFPSKDALLGAQLRLVQLGFLFHEPTGALDDFTRDALVAFRRAEGLSPIPLFDAETRHKLADAYGS